MTTSATRALFERLPRLADLVPFAVLADGLPTPVEQLDTRLWVQHEELTSSVYGGNKVRKFEFVFPVAERRGGPLVTAGGIGSHHVLAAAIHAGRLGLDIDAVLYNQPRSEDVARTQAALEQLDNVRVTRVPSPYLMPAAIATRMAALATKRPYLLWPGASTPLGTLGYVSAAVELANAFEEHGWRRPDVVVVPLGSGGTAVGTALGLAMAGWDDTDVVAVRAADLVVTNRAVVGALEASTAALLALAGWRPRSTSLRIDRHWFGGTYGKPTRAGDEAMRIANDMGMILEPTYTAKAFAAALDQLGRGKRVAFIQTFAGT
ncbi:MAG: pyridoxal-phosphate dependent enzyme [Acidimicrobiia bacterium]|nr:pyridoxal-phosphate dependent enzyme [Acidimicrobiia bacterium]